MVYVFTHGPSTDECGFDAAVADNFGGEGTEKGLSLIGGFVQFGDAFTMTHFEGCGGGCRGDCDGVVPLGGGS